MSFYYRRWREELELLEASSTCVMRMCVVCWVEMQMQDRWAANCVAFPSIIDGFLFSPIAQVNNRNALGRVWLGKGGPPLKVQSDQSGKCLTNHGSRESGVCVDIPVLPGPRDLRVEVCGCLKPTKEDTYLGKYAAVTWPELLLLG